MLKMFAPMISGATLLPDFFLEGEDPAKLASQMEAGGAKPAFQAGRASGASSGAPTGRSSGGSGTQTIFNQIQSLINPDLLKTVNGVYAFHLKGKFTSSLYSLQQ